MSIIGDYGMVNNVSVNNNTISTERKSQVFQATHDGEGRLLPSRYRSFISFSFGGKNIEDFNLIACCESDTMTRRAYAEFEDLTTEYDIMDGQYYHGTHYKPNTLSLKLVSDDLDQKQLDEFLYWFAGGKIRELILAEHPNRAIMARVAETPEIDVIPFEKTVKMSFSGQTYETSTTLYKGFITLDLVADMPFWYAKQNLFVQDQNGYASYNGQSIYSDVNTLKEALKISYEDTIPISDMIAVTMYFGEDKFASITDENTPYTIIAGPLSISQPEVRPEDWPENTLGYFEYEVDGEIQYWRGARVSNTEILGRIAGAAIMDVSSAGNYISAGSNDFRFFYGGTAPSPTILSFDIDFMPSIIVEENGQAVSSSSSPDEFYLNDLPQFDYIDCFDNTYKNTSGKEYSTISIISQHQKNFDITIPNVMSSWNKAKKIIDEIIPYDENDSEIKEYSYQGDIADTLRDQVRHAAARAWAVAIINYLKLPEVDDSNTYITEEGYITVAGKAKMQELLPIFFLHPTGEKSTENNLADKYNDYRNNRAWKCEKAHFTFNAETGEATAIISYWKSSGIWNVVWEVLNKNNYKSGSTIPSPTFLAHASYSREGRAENVGDMIRSNWLIIEDHNRFQNDQVVNWTSDHPENSHYLTHNANRALENLKLEYKNMYL